MAKMSEPEIQAQMATAKGWDRLGDMLVRTWQFASPRRALEFVNQVAALAEPAESQPDIILSHRCVRVEISTRTVGGLTPQDFALAAAIDGLPSDR